MDERRAHELLADAAETVTPSDGLPARAEHRYLRRRARARVVVAAVVVAVIGAGVTTAAIVSRKTTTAPAIAHRSTSTTIFPSGAVDARAIRSISFVDENTGFGLIGSDGEPLATDVVRTADGGRTWRGAGTLQQGESYIHFDNPRDGVAYGEGPLEVTTDGGLHWTIPPTGPDHADSLAWAGGRLWSLVSCSVGAPCNELQISDDSGSTWTTTSRFQPGVGTPAIAAASNTTAYIAWPAAGGPDGRARQIAFTVDGGRSWTYEAAPCEADPRLPLGSALAAADDGTSLLLVCTDGVHNHGYFSTDRGHAWRSEAGLPNGSLNVAASLSSEAFFVGLGGSWTKGPLLGPYPGEWSYENLPQPVGAVRAIDPVIGIGTFFATESGVWFRSDNDRWERRAPAPSSATTTTTTPGLARPVDPSRITAVSFVDANVGFGLDTLDRPTDFVRTVDGGRTWTRVTRFENGNGVSLYFVNADDGVAWGDNQLEVTSDGGADWTKPRGAPLGKVVTWAGDRLWALDFCGRSVTCPSRSAFTSDNVGRTWRPTAPLAPGLGDISIIATSVATAYVAGSDPTSGRSQIAVTNDSGRSWHYRPTPCGRADAHLAYNGHTLLLICAQGPTTSQEFEAFTSDDGGRTWSSPEKDPYVGGYFGALTNVGSAFVAAMQRGDIWASADGKTWRRESNVGEGFWSISTVPGVGAFAATGPADRDAGIVFSPDGLHWEQRTAVRR